ncbi:MAG: hypothetical protein LAT84_02480 [Balneolia bacterium]|nr:hypothetical protein [Balneolia bacterium]
MSSCSVFDDNSESPDFGIKADHVLFEGDEQRPLNRNRNYLNVRFSPDLDEDAVIQLLLDYNLRTFSPELNIVKNNFPALLKVSDKPAEAFYTQYGSSASDSFGNESGVIFALPIYELENSGKKSINNELLLSFDESITPEQSARLLDSLKTSDHLTRIEREWLGDLYLLQVSKELPMNALDLSNHYQTLEFIKTVSPNFGYAIQRF